MKSHQIPRPTRTGNVLVAGLDKGFMGTLKPAAGGGLAFAGNGEATPGRAPGKPMATDKPVASADFDNPAPSQAPKVVAPQPTHGGVISSAPELGGAKGGGGSISTKPKAATPPPIPQHPVAGTPIAPSMGQANMRSPGMLQGGMSGGGGTKPPPIPSDAKSLMLSIEKLHGGLGDRKKDSEFDPKALAAGMEVEKEHTKNKNVAREIAKDHLTEDPHYYCKLKKIEKSLDMLDEMSKALSGNAPPPSKHPAHKAKAAVSPNPTHVRQHAAADQGYRMASAPSQPTYSMASSEAPRPSAPPAPSKPPKPAAKPSPDPTHRRMHEVDDRSSAPKPEAAPVPKPAAPTVAKPTPGDLVPKVHSTTPEGANLSLRKPMSTGGPVSPTSGHTTGSPVPKMSVSTAPPSGPAVTGTFDMPAGIHSAKPDEPAPAAGGIAMTGTGGPQAKAPTTGTGGPQTATQQRSQPGGRRNMGSAFGEGFGMGSAAAGDLSSPAGGTAPLQVGAQTVASKIDTSTWGGARYAGAKSGGSRSPAGVSATAGQAQPRGLNNQAKSVSEQMMDAFHKSFDLEVGPSLYIRGTRTVVR